MIATDRFVFLHLHKSGGSFVNEFLLRFVPSAQAVGYHLPRALLPREYRGLPVFGFVRNPWSYYVSWYHFQAERQQPNALFRILSDNGRLDFSATVRNMLELGSGGDRLDAVIDALPAAYGSSGLNLPNFALAPIRHTRLGFYSFLYRYLYGEPDRQLSVERAEELRVKLADRLQDFGVPLSDPMRDHLCIAPPRNASVHGPYADYYSDELRDLVAERDQLVIERHGYRFGDSGVGDSG
ncbi:MAG: hypothetical protein ACLPX1_02690 [Steroidobacteraceae bacterium]